MILAFTILIIIINTILGLFVLLSNYKNASNFVFFLITVTFSLLAIVNYFSIIATLPNVVLFWARIVMFLAATHTFLFVLFSKIFPSDKIVFDKFIGLFVISYIFIAIIGFSKLIFEKIIFRDGEIISIPGKLIPIYGIWIIICIAIALYLFIKKYILSKDILKSRLKFILFGATTTYLLLVFFNFIVVNLLNDTIYVKFTPFFSLPFIIFTAYAIIKHQLFNIKVIATELLVFAIWIIILVELLIADTLRERILDGGVLLFVFFAGVLLIRSVKKEVKQREDLEVLTHELKHANEELRQLDKAKSEFISIASHQLRTPLSVTKGYVSMILEGIYGDISDKIKDILQKVFIVNEGLIDLVNNLLDLSRMEAGTLKYEFKDIDLVGIIDEIVMELELEAKHRNLSLTWQKPQGPMPMISADSIKFKQVIEILIENSLKYTPNGGVDVSLAKENNSLLFKVKDTGIGLDPKELDHLFNKFGRGVAGSKINAGGVGLGLYTAKQIVLAHKGEIWAESEGPGKGSAFVVRLPIG